MVKSAPKLSRRQSPLAQSSEYQLVNGTAARSGAADRGKISLSCRNSRMAVWPRLSGARNE